MEAEYEDLLCYCEVRSVVPCLRGFILFERKPHFLQDKAKSMPKLHDPELVNCLPFIVDVIKHLNNLNIKFQIRDQHVEFLLTNM